MEMRVIANSETILLFGGARKNQELGARNFSKVCLHSHNCWSSSGLIVLVYFDIFFYGTFFRLLVEVWKNPKVTVQWPQNRKIRCKQGKGG